MKQWIKAKPERLFVVAAVLVIVSVPIGARWSERTEAGSSDEKAAINNQTGKDNHNTGDTKMLTDSNQQQTVLHANDADFAQVVLDSDVPVLVDFYADWCGPCRLLGPVLEELASETTDAKIVKVNVDQAPQLAHRYGIESIPSLKVFKDGKVVDDHLGLANKSQLKALLDI